MKNNTLRIILAIVGAAVLLGAAAVAVIHFWDDIKSILPFKKDENALDEFADLEI